MTNHSIVFFGNEKLATGIPEPRPIILEALRQAGYDIESVVTGTADLNPHESQVAVLAAHGRILPQAVLDEFPLGIINIHPSLLPIYRGPTPIEQAILDGATKTGVSIMRLANEMDAGPIYKQESLQLNGDETKAELAERLQQRGAELLLEVLPEIIAADLQPRQQPHVDRDVSYTRLIRKDDGIVDWTKPAEQLEREVRAYAGWPGSRTTLFSKDIIITSAHVSDHDEPLSIKAGDGKYLVIDRLKPAGKKEMTAADFLRGLRD